MLARSDDTMLMAILDISIGHSRPAGADPEQSRAALAPVNADGRTRGDPLANLLNA